ncbi:O-linked N-acetylglucosamine (GlcNAc) transferase [Nesidiocoris tenuis]|uniref:O-linked N-acetylglucosamine (GlcNAc) transferase n=1 Tax=Nesidiocoris tenuis TaxID=355587 RepID=A0ABN7B7S2_9HEMI|nr:O-linked N-acetylglucosamine (GlcNAc) transferase [Nesidiocoris tenuis]
MDYQCIIVYTIITILPNKTPPPEVNQHQTGCLAWIKRWIKRSIFVSISLAHPNICGCIMSFFAFLALTKESGVFFLFFSLLKCVFCFL